MNWYLFAVKNILDKVAKMPSNPGMINNYFHTFVLARLKAVDPDVYIVSYPKCGSTWIRVMLHKYLDLMGARDGVGKDRFVIKLTNGEVLKIDHDLGSWIPAPPRPDRMRIDERKYRNKKVCFLTRHPGDVLVSSWYHLKFREKIFTGTLSEFIRDDLVGIRKVVAFMNLWADFEQAVDDYLLLTYEELREDPVDGFLKLFSFAGMDVDEEKLRLAVEETSFEKMKERELRGDKFDPWTKLGAEKSEKALKTRNGKVGGYKDEMNTEDTNYIETVIKESLSEKYSYGREGL